MSTPHRPAGHQLVRLTASGGDRGCRSGGDVPDLRRALLRHQRVGALLGLLGAMLIVNYGDGTPLWTGILVGVLAAGVGIRRIIDARIGLSRLDAEEPLPAARILR